MTKLAFHVQEMTPAARTAVLRQRNAVHLKTMDVGDLETLYKWKENNPGGKISFRRYNREADLAEGTSNIDRWREFCDRMLTHLRDHGAEDVVDICYSPFNEVAPYPSQRLNEYVDRLKEMGDYLRGSGYEVAAGNWSVTTPHPIESWRKISECFPHVDYIVLHGYSKPTLRDLEKELYPHEAAIDYLRANSLPVPRFILGEFGVDHAVYSNPVDFSGWQKSMSPVEYATQLIVADERLGQYDEVVAASVFNLDNNGKGWDTYKYASYPEILDVFSRRTKSSSVVPAADKEPVNDVKVREWLPAVLESLFNQWRNTEGNTWPLYVDREQAEFWAHARALNVDVNQYPNASPEMIKTVREGGSYGSSPLQQAMAHDTDATLDEMIPAAASQLRVSEKLLRAVIDIESGGIVLTPDGNPPCRFEVKQWARRNPDGWSEAQQYFRGEETWQGGDDQFLWNGSWHQVHGRQDFRRIVIAFAATYGVRDQAFQCSSWGFAQLMGWHYGMLGYESAEKMAYAFCDGRKQMDGFVKFLEATGAAQCLRVDDIEGFVRIYNGSGQIEHYSRLIRERIAKSV